MNKGNTITLSLLYLMWVMMQIAQRGEIRANQIETLIALTELNQRIEYEKAMIQAIESWLSLYLVDPEAAIVDGMVHYEGIQQIEYAMDQWLVVCEYQDKRVLRYQISQTKSSDY